ncbi:glycosyltransferase family A protein [Sphingobium sp. H39-3-25]|uniref:glycosyltransferase family A protein n=1 Tax=Sphingobium arseniciresistens TaxID=3030834 RepID=UPI0023B9FFA4|nr:glycosyltransferase family A protein [Sphingobium arseniciresistens]
MTIAVAIFAHNEQRRIARCLNSLPLDRADLHFHLLVNGSTDHTAAIASAIFDGSANTQVHELYPGGKSRTWNRFVHEIGGMHDAYIFMDGDAEIAPGALDALIDTLSSRPHANAAAGMPLNGRHHQSYRAMMIAEGGLFGDLYALSGAFVRDIRARGLSLPEDLIGDDGLVCAWAMTGLSTDAHWDRDRVVPCEQAGFLCEPVALFHPVTWRVQYRRMMNYSVRHYQNRIISDIMGREGPSGLPPRMAALYADWLPRFTPRSGITGWFDRKALARMRSA